MNNPFEQPDLSDYSKTRAVVKGVTGSVPLVDPMLAEFVGLIYPEPRDRHLERWMASTCDALYRLHQKQLIMWDELKKQETFRATFNQIFREAMTTSIEEKLQLYQNAIINSALNSS